MPQLLKTLIRKIRQPQIRIQILSDLHLEIGQQYMSYTFPVTAPFLLLAGDIGRLVDYGNYKAFLEMQASRYKKVFLVLGNHEFMNSTMIQEWSRWDDPDSNLTILGCTLCQIHIEEAEWLRKEVAQLATQDQDNSRQIVIVTHHAPCLQGTSKPADTNSPWTPAFATDLVTKGNWGNVTCWIFGHTHYSTDFQYKGIRLLANQWGYVFPKEKVKSKTKRDPHVFDPAMAIKL
ncbi:calcineurin-like phosphoesterase domain-containing protein [Trichoderma breve]|uniref:Calcineurin-like phosphoesterase domain-containing protein n=1 Tax=Trichoderma breve TaxID=2034170 RepID=A0A9W9EF27_9HYPO|nr:calcineurin-like phosphoesterase domain-containing protein [Trichoderma breve]KAJ4865490.1 calcineurin-like phosphoesterase domain-containing protein [Trichoderma breve]